MKASYSFCATTDEMIASHQPIRSWPMAKGICLDILDDSCVHSLLEAITAVHFESIAALLLRVVAASFASRRLGS